MDFLPRHFPNVGVVEAQLPEDVVENIWKVTWKAYGLTSKRSMSLTHRMTTVVCTAL